MNYTEANMNLEN